ncbi:hypothetical protein P171DRAFT_371739 [Karstenula rhodostoma CBS 690.94]|uniref:F-box domain-containing protein n=1 Tax=Karstenula rhodostoma CBS 690.94 TaxID=1392251 RepID=A0A9P4U5Z3_9PLEO|nr:hypothetical protein P171DRAFT_371739 [Karstenula rhodostoma CBS 690.94]
MERLPNELLVSIASHLDVDAPSVKKFSHEPTARLTVSDDTPLKNLSQVSWRWRKILLPILFRYSRIPLDPSPQWVPIDARILDNMQGQLTKLSNHEIQIYTRMMSKFKATGTGSAFDQAFDDVLINLCRVEDDDKVLKSVPHILWFPHLFKNFAQFLQFVEQYDLKNHIKNIVVYTDKEYQLRHVSTADAPLAHAIHEIWDQIFSNLDPNRLVVAAPPSTLSALLDAQMLSSDTWAFDMKMHYVEFLQQDPQRSAHRNRECRPWGNALVHRKPWTHLGYNEGSSITAYSTYEYHLKQSPKMLYLTLLRLAKEVQNCCNITSFSFIGVFPFSTNLNAIIRALQKIPTLREIQVQLAPGPENDLLNTPKRLGRAQSADLWLEWNGCYSALAGLLGTQELGDGARFVSKDCGEKEVAKEVEEYIESLQKRGQGWRKDGHEAWIRDTCLDQEAVPDEHVEDAESALHQLMLAAAHELD